LSEGASRCFAVVGVFGTQDTGLDAGIALDHILMILSSYFARKTVFFAPYSK